MGEQIYKLTSIFIKAKDYNEFRNWILPFCTDKDLIDSWYMMVLNAKKPLTSRPQKHYYRRCQSFCYLDLISSQISLLQIPLSYMLDAGYDIEKILNLIKELIPICIHSNWLSLLIKYSGIEELNNSLFTENDIKTMKGIIEVTMERA